MNKYFKHLIIILIALSSVKAKADFYLVVQANNPQQTLTKKEAVNLFMGKSRAFSNGDFALVFDLPRDDPARATFYKALTGLNHSQINSYWSRLMFSGQSMPPQSLPNEQAMLDIVKRNPSGLGWVRKKPSDSLVRVVLVLKEEP